MVFRIFLIVITMVLWALALWWSSHESETAEIFGRYSIAYFISLVGLFGIAIATSISTSSRNSLHDLAGRFVRSTPGSVVTILPMSMPS